MNKSFFFCILKSLAPFVLVLVLIFGSCGAILIPIGADAMITRIHQSDSIEMTGNDQSDDEMICCESNSSATAISVSSIRSENLETIVWSVIQGSQLISMPDSYLFSQILFSSEEPPGMDALRSIFKKE